MTVTELQAELQAANDLIDSGARAFFEMQVQRDEWRRKYHEILARYTLLEKAVEAQS